jgi:hypothetical protein
MTSGQPSTTPTPGDGAPGGDPAASTERQDDAYASLLSATHIGRGAIVLSSRRLVEVRIVVALSDARSP